MKEYVVTFSISYQIAEDAWEVCHPTLKVSENTTVKEIENLYRKYVGTGEMEIRLSELINIEKKEDENDLPF